LKWYSLLYDNYNLNHSSLFILMSFFAWYRRAEDVACGSV